MKSRAQKILDKDLLVLGCVNLSQRELKRKSDFLGNRLRAQMHVYVWVWEYDLTETYTQYGFKRTRYNEHI